MNGAISSKLLVRATCSDVARRAGYQPGDQVAGLSSVSSQGTFTYVDGVVDATLAAARSRVTDAFNVGAGTATSVREVLRVAERLTVSLYRLRRSLTVRSLEMLDRLGRS